MQKNAQEICAAIALDLKQRGYTHQRVADELGKTKNVISNQLSGKRPFSKQMALLFAAHFDYNIDFLLYGEGELRKPVKARSLVLGPEGPEKLDASVGFSLVEIAKFIISVTGYQEGLDAMNFLMEGDFSGYKLSMEALMRRCHVSGPAPLLMARLVAKQINSILMDDDPRLFHSDAEESYIGSFIDDETGSVKDDELG